MWDVLEHLPDLDGTLTEIKRILKPGGLFWGQVPYGPHANVQMVCWQHCHTFVPKTFSLSIAEDFGFETVEVKCVSWKHTWQQKLRNLVPFRSVLAEAGWTIAFDNIEFKLRKPSS
jgi:SAM-dependent methyltransferase